MARSSPRPADAESAGAVVSDQAVIDELRQLRELMRRKFGKEPAIHVGTAEAARILAVSAKTLMRWVKEGKIKRFVDGGVCRYRIADLESFSRRGASDGKPE